MPTIVSSVFLKDAWARVELLVIKASCKKTYVVIVEKSDNEFKNPIFADSCQPLDKITSDLVMDAIKAKQLQCKK